MELRLHGLGSRTGWSGASAVGYSTPKLKTSRLHNDPRVRALGEVLTHVSRFNPSIWWTHQEMSKLITKGNFVAEIEQL